MVNPLTTRIYRDSSNDRFEITFLRKPDHPLIIAFHVWKYARISKKGWGGGWLDSVPWRE